LRTTLALILRGEKISGKDFPTFLFNPFQAVDPGESISFLPYSKENAADAAALVQAVFVD
jgi:hypothetical protein